jgi:glycosyltransferase involved in cell wall biosynthesis
MQFRVIEDRRDRWEEYARLALRRVFHPAGRAIAVAPAVTINPYQRLIYSGWAAHHAVGLDLATAAKLARRGLIHGLHLHWDEFLFPAARPAVCAANHAVLAGVRDGGGRIAFTLHNDRPHADLDRAESLAHFRDWRQRLLPLCDAVHVHSRAARDMLLADYEVAPDRVHVVPHPSYRGVYAPVAAGPGPADRRRFLSFGTVRPNKGIATLIAAFRRLDATDREVELHLAGRGAEAFQGTDLGRARLVLSPGFVSDTALPGLFAEAEFCVFGFDSALTSGSLMLALTLGKPVVLPRFPSLIEVFEGHPMPLSYAPGDVAELADVLAQAAAMPPDEIVARGRDSLKVAAAFDPVEISRRLETVVVGEKEV